MLVNMIKPLFPPVMWDCWKQEGGLSAVAMSELVSGLARPGEQILFQQHRGGFYCALHNRNPLIVEGLGKWSIAFSKNAPKQCLCTWENVSVLTTLSLCNTDPSRWDAVAWSMKTNTPFYKCHLLSSKTPVLMTAGPREWKLSVTSVERQRAIFKKGLNDHQCNLLSGMWAVKISGILNILSIFIFESCIVCETDFTRLSNALKQHYLPGAFLCRDVHIACKERIVTHQTTCFKWMKRHSLTRGAFPKSNHGRNFRRYQ